MPDSISIRAEAFYGRTTSVVLLVLIFLIFAAVPLHAAEPVEIIVTGIDGDVLKNVQKTLIPPAGLIRDGKVDRLWLERFARQAEEKARGAIEPFGYYNALITVLTEPAGERSRLLVKVVPGEPLQLDDVSVSVLGPGREEQSLRRLIEKFPLSKGDVLLQQKYEEAKSALKTRAINLGYLDADFLLHEIRITPRRHMPPSL